MKRRTLFAVASLLLFGACTNEDANEVLTTHEITLNVSAFGVSYEPLSRAITDPAELGSKIKAIDYLVLRNGSCFSIGTQTYSSNPTTFGQITLQVPSGDCDVRLAGFGEGTNNAYIGSNNSAWGIWGEQREVYYAAVNGVNVANNTVYEAELKRKTGAITLNIVDANNAPSHFGGIRIGYNLPTYWFMNLNSSSEYRSGSRVYSGTTSNFPNIFIHTWPHTEGLLTLEVVDTGNNTIKTKKINYNVYENRKTIITGELFGGEQEFTVSISDEWDEDNIIEFE